MKKKSLICRIGGIAAAAVLLTGCGSSYASNSAQKDASPGMFAAAEETAEETTYEDVAYDGDMAYDGGEAYDEASAEAWDMAAEADWDDADAGDDGADDPAATEAAVSGRKDGSLSVSQDKIIYTCSVDLQTLEYEKSAEALKAGIKKTGGFIQSETESDDNYYWYSDSPGGSTNRTLYVTARIPAGQYEAFIEGLDAYGKVLNKTQSADNISKTYHDKESYISSLETEQKRLLEMMDKAETIEDMIAVEERLTEVQRQLNQHRTELESMDIDVAYSTVTLNLEEVRKLSDEPTVQDSFGTRIRRAFAGAWSGFGEFCQDFVLAVIYLLPAIILIGAIVWIVLFATRKRRRARKEKKRAEHEMIEDMKKRAQEQREQGK